MIGIISCVSINGVIGITENGKGKLPFHYPDDMRFFKETTQDSIIIMGRKTFESIGKPLPNRENIVITSSNLKNTGVKTYSSISQAMSDQFIILRGHYQNIWFIGGERVYQEGMLYADEIYLTLAPDYIENNHVTKFPFINPLMFELCGYTQLCDPPSNKLICAIYKRKIQNNYYEKIIENVKGK